MPAMISRIIAAEFSFWWPVHRRAQAQGEIWPEFRLLTVRFRTLGPSVPYWYGGLSSSQIYHLVRPGGARSSGSCPTKGSIGIWLTSRHYDEQRHVARPHIRISCVKCDRAGHMW